MKRLLPLVVLFLILGCGRQNIAYHPTKDTGQMRQDKSECEYEAQKYSYTPVTYAGSGFAAGIQEGMQQASLTKKCMEVRGYEFISKEEAEARGATIRPW